MKYQEGISTIVVVGICLLCVVVVMGISLAVTTESDQGFQLTPEQQQATDAYYQKCPFKKAELEDLTDSQSIRKVVEFRSVTCDESTGKESAVVHIITPDQAEGKKQFEQWLNQKGFDTQKIQISYE
jgi:hypothetical protein